MTAPVDLLTATQDWIVGLIRAALPMGEQTSVRHSLDEDAQPPFDLVADIDSENVGGKFEQLETITVEIHTVYRGDDRGELLARMHRVRIAVDGAEASTGGVSFRSTWLNGSASPAASDGVTFVGITTLEIYAEPA